MKKLFYESLRHVQDQVEEVQTHEWTDNGVLGSVAEKGGKMVTLVYAWGQPANVILEAIKAPLQYDSFTIGGPFRRGAAGFLLCSRGISALLGGVIGWMLCLLRK